MEAPPFSRIVIQSLLKLNALKPTEIDTLCKYFLQNLLAGKSTVAFGMLLIYLYLYKLVDEQNVLLK